MAQQKGRTRRLLDRFLGNSPTTGRSSEIGIKQAATWSAAENPAPPMPVQRSFTAPTDKKGTGLGITTAALPEVRIPAQSNAISAWPPRSESLPNNRPPNNKPLPSLPSEARTSGAPSVSLGNTDLGNIGALDGQPTPSTFSPTRSPVVRLGSRNTVVDHRQAALFALTGENSSRSTSSSNASVRSVAAGSSIDGAGTGSSRPSTVFSEGIKETSGAQRAVPEENPASRFSATTISSRDSVRSAVPEQRQSEDLKNYFFELDIPTIPAGTAAQTAVIGARTAPKPVVISLPSKPAARLTEKNLALHTAGEIQRSAASKVSEFVADGGRAGSPSGVSPRSFERSAERNRSGREA